MAKAAVHFGSSALQAAVKLVDFEAVDLADVFRCPILTPGCRGVIVGFSPFRLLK